MRPAGSKHQPWQAKQLTPDGILTISTQGAPDGQSNRWQPSIEKTPVCAVSTLDPARNKTSKQSGKNLGTALQPGFGTTVFAKFLRFFPNSSCPPENLITPKPVLTNTRSKKSHDTSIHPKTRKTASVKPATRNLGTDRETRNPTKPLS